MTVFGTTDESPIKDTIIFKCLVMCGWGTGSGIFSERRHFGGLKVGRHAKPPYNERGYG